MAVYLAYRWNAYPVARPLGLWLRVLLVTIVISLLFDYYDVFLYLSGRQIAA